MNASLSPGDFLPRQGNCLLLVIDIQERLSAAMPSDVLPGVLRNTCILLETAREMSMPVVVSEQYPKGLGQTLPQITATLPEGARPVDKMAFSVLRDPAFDPYFNAPGCLYADQPVILCGMETHVCVLQTALDLLQQGRKVYVAEDAVCSRAKRNWKLGLDLMRAAGAVIGSTEMFAFGLLEKAGTETFKRISRLVK